MRFFTIALLLALSTAASAQVEPTLSEECGKWSAEIKPKPENGEGGERATVYFEDFHIKLAKSKENRSRDCHAKVKVTVPKGKALKFISAVVEGSAKLHKKSKAEVSLKADIDIYDKQFSDKVKLKKSGKFAVEAAIDDPEFTKCSNKAQVMTIDLDLRAYLKHRGKGTSVLELDDLNKNHHFTCNWQWKDCEDPTPPPFQKPLTTYYKFENERAYKALVSIKGDSGSYAADDKGVEGELSDISYKEGGLKAEGRWSEEGYDGWFKWKMINIKTGRFRGTFGKDVTDRHGKVRSIQEGTWWGYYTDYVEEEDGDDR